MAGPLSDVRVIELAGLGALPYGSLRLADMGAHVIRIDRKSQVPAEPVAGKGTFWDRGRRSIGVDLKHPDGVETVLRLAEGADVLLESFRPGVVERLGLGPDVVLARNPRIVFGRLTGWGQTGPLAHAAGHSLNYEALTGFIGSVGPPGGPPVPVLNVLGDFAGGGLHLAYGVVCAVIEARRSGQGQVVDAAMVDGGVSLLAPFYSMQQMGMHTETIGENLFDGGAPHYAVYETSDGKYVSVAPIEPHFWTLLLEQIGLDPEKVGPNTDRSRWPEQREQLAAVFRTRTRDEWCELLEGTDACFAPVLSFSEATRHPHNQARGVFGGARPAPAPSPRMSRTPGEPGPSPAYVGADTDAVLGEAGFSEEEIAGLRERGAIA
ncbi:MAG: CaiB/BaiF CoA-transferase family protein [Myxococcota bacterium]|nr:CaiB/BaiF CoA-transferase family protein [Myxococcota bacterium]